jgi:hypothetical protein
LLWRDVLPRLVFRGRRGLLALLDWGQWRNLQFDAASPSRDARPTGVRRVAVLAAGREERLLHL